MSDTRRCPVCGAEVTAGAQFCTNCGARLDEAEPQPTQPAPSPAPQPAPSPSPAVTPGPQPSPNRRRTLVIALCSVAAALAVVAVVLAVVNVLPSRTNQASNTLTTTPQVRTYSSSGNGSGQDDSTAPSNVTQAPSSGADNGNTDTGSTDGSAGQDAAVLATLRSEKSTLNSLDSQIRSVASDFNKYAKDGSWDQQEAAATTASQVQGQVSSASSTFDTVSVPSSSSYYGDYQSMQVCYDDLQNRIDCMVNAWNLRLNGSSDYLSPIRAQNDAKGVNIYKTDFENRMASLGV